MAAHSLLYRIADRVLIVRGDHNGVALILQPTLQYVGHEEVEAALVHRRGRLVAGVDRVLVAERFRPQPFLFHVGATDQLGAKVEALTAGKLHVNLAGLVGALTEKEERKRKRSRNSGEKHLN